MLLGVGHGTEGALRQGDMKIIVGNPGRIDGWSAQYPGSSFKEDPPPIDSEASCTAEHPCLFNVTADIREEYNLASTMPVLTEKLLQRYKELAKIMDVANGYEDRLESLIWDGSYHVPPVANSEACDVMRKTGFWLPWKEDTTTATTISSLTSSNYYSKEFPLDGPARNFPEDMVLI